MTENNDIDPRQRMRQNRGDPLHDHQLLRAAQAINEQTMRALGPLPPGGLPVQPKRKPHTPRPAVPAMTQTPAPSDEDMTMQWKSVAAVAALATGSTLAACGAEGTTAHVDPPAVAVPHAPTPAPLLTVEAVPHAAEATVAESAAPDDPNAPEPARGPAIPAAQLRRQILALLGSFQKLDDLEHENVKRTMQIELSKRPAMEDGYQYFGTTTEGWGYRVGVSRLGRMDEPPTILIDLDEGVEPWTNQQPTYCTLEFDPLAKELVAMGYERGQRARYSGGDWVWGFGRESTVGNAAFGIGVSVYDLTLPDGTKQVCVEGFDVGGSSRDG